MFGDKRCREFHYTQGYFGTSDSVANVHAPIFTETKMNDLPVRCSQYNTAERRKCIAKERSTFSFCPWSWLLFSIYARGRFLLEVFSLGTWDYGRRGRAEIEIASSRDMGVARIELRVTNILDTNWRTITIPNVRVPLHLLVIISKVMRLI